MSNIKPTKAQMFNGLRRRPKYEEISHEINPDKTKVIYPNRDAKFLREDPRMTQLDGVGFFESMQNQEEATIKEQRKETTRRQIAKDKPAWLRLEPLNLLNQEHQNSLTSVTMMHTCNLTKKKLRKV